ncbi:MAG: hypothetical protein J6Y94_04405 [Bacteriovoracaceae bacterium]|nr:hypothetical protein [Bacteriovoracaceae bacterium]
MNLWGRLFYKMDSAAFNLLARWQKTDFFHKIVQFCQQLDDQQRRWLAPLGLSAIFVLPLLLLLICGGITRGVHKDIRLYEQAIIEIENFRYGQAQLASLEASFVSPRPVANYGDFDQYLRSVFGPLGLNMVSFKVSDFELDALTNHISQVKANLSFSQISNPDFALLLQGILGPGKMFIGDFHLERDTASNTLKGTIALRYWQKSISLD